MIKIKLNYALGAKCFGRKPMPMVTPIGKRKKQFCFYIRQSTEKSGLKMNTQTYNCTCFYNLVSTPLDAGWCGLPCRRDRHSTQYIKLVNQIREFGF